MRQVICGRIEGAGVGRIDREGGDVDGRVHLAVGCARVVKHNVIARTWIAVGTPVVGRAPEPVAAAAVIVPGVGGCLGRTGNSERASCCGVRP